MIRFRTYATEYANNCILWWGNEDFIFMLAAHPHYEPVKIEINAYELFNNFLKLDSIVTEEL